MGGVRTMRLTVDQARCQGYANCVIEAPDVFDVSSGTGKVVLLVAAPDPARREEVEQAIRSCPVRAIGTDHSG